MNLSKDLSVDKELFSGEQSSKENISSSTFDLKNSSLSADKSFDKFIVYNKCMLFRNKFNSSKEINEFMIYYKNLI